jgi:hypothetical protein
MDKNVSIVKVDKRHYRVIAQENWGLTKAQMKDKHVHHRIRRSDGGTNDPSNLYVCSPHYHDVVWHGGTGGFIGLASEGGKKVHEAKDKNGKSLHALNSLHKEKDEDGKSVNAVKGAEKTNEKKDKNGKSLQGLKNAERLNEAKDENGKSVQGLKNSDRLHEAKDEDGKSVNAVKGANKANEAKDENGKSLAGVKGSEKTNAQIWESIIDGFRSNAGNVARHNKANGWDPNARIRVEG